MRQPARRREGRYSYGISGYDQWGCDVATKFRVPVHEYDCFDTTVPQCSGGTTIFHAECVADASKVENGRPFDSIASQLARNVDAAHRLVMKMDVEGAEWAALSATPDDVLGRIDQLIVEFHGVRDASYLAVVRRLKRFFHVAHIHFNNFVCETGVDPFPSWAYEVLFVNQRLDRIDPSRAAGGLHPLDAPNNPALPDCPLKTSHRHRRAGHSRVGRRGDARIRSGQWCASPGRPDGFSRSTSFAASRCSGCSSSTFTCGPRKPAGSTTAIRTLIWRLVESKSHGTFALLFGAGFAILLRARKRAANRSPPFTFGGSACSRSSASRRTGCSVSTCFSGTPCGACRSC